MKPRVLREPPADKGNSRQPVLIVGASARAAAFSAIRAGMRPVAADLYGDSDLRTAAEYIPIADYPHGLPAAVESLPEVPWIYTGALENHPAIIGRVAERHPLWGNPPETLRAVRDPFQVALALTAAGLPALEVRDAHCPPPADGSWLIKPRRSGGGRGIGLWTAGNGNSPTLREPHCFQRRVRGTAISAIFIGSAAGTRLVGITQQFLGPTAQTSDLPGRETMPIEGPTEPAWMYVGGIAPLQLPSDVHETIEAIGQAVGAAFTLRGLFGCDFCLEEETPWLTEINPRYTAAVELLELSLSRAFLRDHRRVFQSTDDELHDDKAPVPSDDDTGTHGNQRFAAKMILFAETPLVITHDPAWHEQDQREERPWIADLPAVGTHISSGHPICTVLATASTSDECRARLAETAAEVWHHLTGVRRRFQIEQ